MSAPVHSPSLRRRSPEHWHIRPLLSTRTLVGILLAIIVLMISAQRTDIGRLATLSAEAAAVMTGMQSRSQVSDGFVRIVSGMFPLQLAEVRETSRIEHFDRTDLPWGAHIETRAREVTNLDPSTLQMRTAKIYTEVLVEPFGYLFRVLGLMVETIEIAAWGTMIALFIAGPLAYCSSRNYAPHALVFAAARALSSLLRAIPEIISALLLVLIFGFGPVAGVLALGLHTAGFLSKFFAEDVENAPVAPQDALRAGGANKLEVLRHAVLPQVLPSYLGYIQYVLERNIRSATVIGIVGAGGVGQELKGRFEMFDFAHVGTVLAVIFASVLALEFLTSRLRRRLM